MSARISQDFVQDLIARADILDLVQRRITLKKMGSNYSACCPFHQEKTPSFTVSTSKQFYHCFGCGAHGNAIGFLMDYDRLSFVEAVEELAHHLGMAIPKEFSGQKTKIEQSLYTLLEKITQYYQSQLRQSSQVLTYLEARGISKEMIKHFNIGFAPPGWDNVLRQFGQSAEAKTSLFQTGMLIKNEQGRLYDRFRNRLVIPIRDQRGRVIAFGGRTLTDEIPKYLNSPETSLFHKGKEFFGLYEARQSKHFDFCLIVEGYMDVIALHQFGITQAVGTMGTATNTKHLQYLLRYVKDLIFCFDGDAAGQEAAWRALENSLPVFSDGVQIRFMFLPKKHDPDSIIREEGVEAFHQRIVEAVPLSEFFFQELSVPLSLQNPDAKAKLVKLAKPLLQKIPSGIFNELMVKRLAELTQISVDTLEKHVHASQPLLVATQPNDAIETGLSFTVKTAIALLLQNPALAQTIPYPVELQQVQLMGVPTLLKLFEQLKTNPSLSTGALLELWRNSKAVTHLGRLAALPLLTPPTGMAAELSDILQKIMAQNRELNIQALRDKQRQKGLSAEEKNSLIKLLKERH